jgi:hypothetical protein
MVMVGDLNMEAKHIPETKLVKAWKTLSSKPMPKIKALKLNNEDFEYVIKHRQCYEDEKREIEEWGRVLSTEGTDACVFNAEKTGDDQYFIIVRENPYHRLDEIIIHELSHIARGDL